MPDQTGRSVVRGSRVAKTVAVVLALVLLSGGAAWAMTSGPVNGSNGGVRSLVYEPPGSISGTVTDSSTNLLQNICVKAYDSNDVYSGYDETDSNGGYVLSGLVAGNYRVKFYDCGDNSVSREFYDNQESFYSANPVTVAVGTNTPNINAQLTKGGSISGTITDDSANELEGICARAYDSDGRRHGLDETDADGNYSVGALPTGTYRVKFYDCADNNVLTEYYDDAPDLDSATPVAVTTGVDKPGIDADLAEGGSFSGTVTDSSADEIEGVCVRAYDSDGRNSGSDMTDSNGDYEVDGLNTGSYRVRFDDCGENNVIGEYYDDGADYDSATPVPVATGTNTPNVDAELAKGGSIAGSVTDGSGSPIEDICVYAYNGNSGFSGYSFTDSDGNYMVQGLLTGQYKVSFFDCGSNDFLNEYYNNKPDYDSANAVVVTTGIETDGINAQLDKGGSISGTVRDVSNNPLEDVCVRAYNSSGSQSGSDTTDSTGHYVINGLKAGNFRVRFSDCGDNNALTEFYDNKTTLGDATPVEVELGTDTSGIDAQLAKGGSISGTITDSSNAPLEDICVRAYPSDTGGGHTGFTGSGYSDSDGHYEVNGLVTGDYRVQFVDCGNNNVLAEYHINKPDYNSADPIAVTTGVDTPNINAQLAKGGSISGTVVDSSSNPLEGICVRALDSDESESGFTVTDLSGQYTFNGLATGGYRLRFSDCGDNNVATEFYNDQPNLGDADPVGVTAGLDTLGIDAELAELGSISGAVTDNSNIPLEGICVRAYNENGGTSGNGKTDAAGHYIVDGLPAGDHRIRFRNCGDNNIADEYYDDKPTLGTADPVEVQVGTDSPGVDAELASLGSISGTVKDSSNHPLEDICVSAEDPNIGEYGEDTTDANGNYRIIGLVTGNYRMEFYDCGNNNVISEYYNNKPSFQTADPVSVTTGIDTPGIDADLADGGSFSGKVTDTSENPLYNVCVYAYDSSGDYVGFDYTNSDGNFVVDGLGTGSYRAGFYDCGSNGVLDEYYNNKQDFSSATSIAVTAGAETPGINAELASYFGSISGTVRDSLENRLAGICVYGYDSSGSYSSYDETNSNGRYVLNGLGDGDYRVRFVDCGHVGVLDEYYENKSTLGAATPIPVDLGSETQNIDAVLAAGDNTAPNTTIDSGPSGTTITTNQATFTFHGTAGDTAKVQCKLDSGAFADCTSPKTFVALENGSHTVSFRAQDAAGNQDATPATSTFTVQVPVPDTTAPDTTIDSGPSGTTITTNQATFTFHGTAGDTDKVMCRLNSEAFADCTSPKTFSSLSDGSHTISFRAQDAAGNQDATPATSTFTVNTVVPDTTAPDTTIDSGPSGTTITTNQATFTFHGTAGDTAKVQCKLDSGAFADCTSPKTFTSLANGSHTVTFRAEDASGNQDGSPATSTFAVQVPVPDTTAPDTTIDSGPSGTITTNQATFTFHGTAGDTAKIQCKLDAGAFADCTSPKTFSSLSDGSHTVSFRAQDAAGNQDATPATRTFTVNTVVLPPPKATISKVSVSGPSKMKKGKKTTYKVKITNSGTAAATGVKLSASGKGVKFSATVGKIAAKKTVTVSAKLKATKLGKVKTTFKVTSSNAGSKTATKTITVKK